MRIRHLPLMCGLLMLAAVTHAQEPEGSPLLIGNGKEATSAQTVEAIRTLIQSLRLPADLSRLWMLHCDAYVSGDHVGEVFRINTYLCPQVFTPRLIRGGTVLCINSTMHNSWFPESPVVCGWSLTDRSPCQYALVASPDRPFTLAGPFVKPFAVLGELADDDVIAVDDAVVRVAPDQQIIHIQVLAAGRVRVLGQGMGRSPDGYRMHNLQIDFEKSGSTWNKTKSGTWVY